MAESAQKDAKAPDQAPESPEKVQEPDNKVSVELAPDYASNGDVSVEVGSFPAVKLSKGKSVKVPVEHARVLASTPFVKVAS